jgi:hypothetical protein
MSQEIVEVVMRWFELFGRGDHEAALQYVDPAISVMLGWRWRTTIGRANGMTSA